jgi:hypothetical protein
MTQPQTRQERLSQGLCSECGKAPRARNLNGSFSVRCTVCRAHLQELYDEDANNGYLDRADFARYAVEVFNAIRAGNTSLAQIKAALGEGYKERWMFDAIDSLMGARLITCTRDLYPQRWAVITEQRVREQRKWNSTSNYETVKWPDSAAIFGEQYAK